MIVDGAAVWVVPMIWGRSYVTAENVADVQQAKADGSARYLLGFNEPGDESQENISARRAPELWPQLSRPA